MLNSIVIFICLSLDRKYAFWENLVKKIKSVCLKQKLVSHYFEYAEFDDDVQFFFFFDLEIPVCVNLV